MKLEVKDLILHIRYMILVGKLYQVQNHILMCPLISQLGPKRHYLPPGQTLEILLIQEEPGMIFKEQVLCYLVMINLYTRPII